MADKQKSQTKKQAPLTTSGLTPGQLRKQKRNEENITRHEYNLVLAKAFGIDPNKSGFRKDVRKAWKAQNLWVGEIFATPL